MPFQVPPNHKFGCVCLTNVAVDRTLQAPLDLGDGLWAVFGTPLELAPHWQEWLGSVKTENFTRAGITIVALHPSDHPEVLDHENKSLTEQAFSVFMGLLMCEIFRLGGGLILSGANNNGRTDVRSLADLESHFMPGGVSSVALSLATIRRASLIASGLRHIDFNRAVFDRLRRGVRAWRRGVQQVYGEDRLHQFVRAVEAVIKPEAGRSAKLFTHRCQIFAGTSASERHLLSELYQMRSLAEHMNPLESVLDTYSPPDHAALTLRRTYQAQMLASDVFEKVLTKPKVLAIFDSDTHIDEFWTRRRTDEQQATWGPPIDLEALAMARLGILPGP
jgi:hypothetical protein